MQLLQRVLAAKWEQSSGNTAAPAGATTVLAGTASASVTAPGVNYKPAPPRGHDPNAPKTAMLADLLRRQDMAGLPVLTPASIFSDGTNQLFDDGAHQDGAPGDGDYANVFTETTKEGTYTWRILARGTLSDGSVFNSVLTVSRWVGVSVDPLSSQLTTQLGLATSLPGVLAGVVTVLPMSATGEFLGPFRGGLVDFNTTSGTWIEPVQSHPDGRYSRTLHYRRGEVPQVTVVVQGKPFTPVLFAEGCLGQLYFLLRRLFEAVARWLRP